MNYPTGNYHPIITRSYTTHLVEEGGAHVAWQQGLPLVEERQRRLWVARLPMVEDVRAEVRQHTLR